MSDKNKEEEGLFESYDFKEYISDVDEDSIEDIKNDKDDYKKNEKKKDGDSTEVNSSKLSSTSKKNDTQDKSAAKTIQASNSDKIKDIIPNPFSKINSKDIMKKNNNTEDNLKIKLSVNDHFEDENNNKNTIFSNKSINNNINNNEKNELGKENENKFNNNKNNNSDKKKYMQNEKNNKVLKNYFIDDPKINFMRLSDMNNNSYMNSVVRCIGSIDKLKDYFLDKKKVDIIYKSIKNMRLSFVIHRLFVHLYYDTKKKIYYPESIKEVLREKSVIFKNHSEINPNICLNFILNEIHNELNLMQTTEDNAGVITFEKKEVFEKGNINFLNNNDSIISKTFPWYEISVIDCDNCEKRQYTFKSFFTFDLDIGNFYQERKRDRISIYECLEFATSKKKLKNFYCPSCNALSQRKRSKYIANTPKIFVFMIDRGNFDEELMKIDFILDDTINIEPYTENIQTSTEYNLLAIVSIFGNKYISFVKIKENWFVFDDSKIQKVEKNIVFNSNTTSGIKHIPCILFYKLVENN